MVAAAAAAVAGCWVCVHRNTSKWQPPLIPQPLSTPADRHALHLSPPLPPPHTPYPPAAAAVALKGPPIIKYRLDFGSLPSTVTTVSVSPTAGSSIGRDTLLLHNDIAGCDAVGGSTTACVVRSPVAPLVCVCVWHHPAALAVLRICVTVCVTDLCACTAPCCTALYPSSPSPPHHTQVVTAPITAFVGFIVDLIVGMFLWPKRLTVSHSG
jgi:hypothetical protein